MAARWRGTITMGSTGRDRRVRARTSKRRTPSQRREKNGDEAEEVAAEAPAEPSASSAVPGLCHFSTDRGPPPP